MPLSAFDWPAVANLAVQMGKYAYNRYKNRTRVGPNLRGSSVRTSRTPSRPIGGSSSRRIAPRLRRTTVPLSRFGRKRKRTFRKRIGYGRKSITSSNTNIYRKRFKGFRKFNRGKFSIGRFLMGGGNFPNQTFVRMKFRATNTIQFDGTATSRLNRTLEVNSIVNHADGLEDVFTTGTNWSYLDVFKTFYEEYLMLGCLTKLSIHPNMVPTFTSNYSATMSPSAVSQFAATSSTGYWYVRLYYAKSKPDPLDPEGAYVGFPMVNSTDGLPVNERNIWPTLRDFLTDPTVMYFKDEDIVKAKTGYLYPAVANDLSLSSKNAIPANIQSGYQYSPQVYYEIESKNRVVSFNIKFSAKKHFCDKNILNNGDWREWSTGLGDNRYRFFARFGYMAFNYNNIPCSEIPSNSMLQRRVTLSSTAYFGLRKPLITPSSHFNMSLQAKNAVNRSIEEVEAMAAMEYAINRNRSDVPTIELERELDEEIDNLLESGEEEEEEEEEQETQDKQDNDT